MKIIVQLHSYALAVPNTRVLTQLLNALTVSRDCKYVDQLGEIGWVMGDAPKFEVATHDDHKVITKAEAEKRKSTRNVLVKA